MSLKLYFQYNGKLVVHPDQMEAIYECEKVTWNIHPDLIPKGKCQLLTEINWENHEVTSILEEYPMEFYVSHTKLAGIKEHNTKFLLNLKKNKKVDLLIKKPDDLYMTDSLWHFLTSTITLKKYPLIIGPKGSGKTVTMRALAHGLKRKFFPINCGSIFKPKQTLVGTVQAVEGSTYIVDSEFMKNFISEEPTFIFLDEISRIPPGAANTFMTILDREQSYIYVEDKGERVYKGENVVFGAAANFGFEYTDTRNIDGAFLDRFIKFFINYPSEEEEIELLQQRAPKAKLEDIKKLVSNANMCRENADLRVAVSTRQLIDMAHFLEINFELGDVIDEIFMNLFYNGTMDDRQTVKILLDGKM